MPPQASDAAREAGALQQAPAPRETSDGDRALILWMLSLDPTRRLEVAQGFVESVEALRHGRRG
jgi:hypothetical protein